MARAWRPALRPMSISMSFPSASTWRVDGERNAVTEVNFAAVPVGAGNPHGNAIRINETPLAGESEASATWIWPRRAIGRSSIRISCNALGEPVAYKLVPGINALPFNDPESAVGRRAGFMYKHFWATQYAKGELYPAGWYPNQHEGGDGLPRWTEKNRSLENENVVVWYTHQLPPPAAPRGLAGAALRLCLVPLDAVGLLRSATRRWMCRSPPTACC